MKYLFILLFISSCTGSGGGSSTRFVDESPEYYDPYSGYEDEDIERICQSYIDKYEEEIYRLNNKIDDIETITKELENELSDLRTEVDNTSEDDLEYRISNIESNLSDVENVLYKLKNEF